MATGSSGPSSSSAAPISTQNQNPATSSSSSTSTSKLPTKLTSETFDDYYAALQSLALNSTRTALKLPSDIGFHKSLSSEYARSSEKVEGRLLELTNRLLSLVESDPGSTSNVRYGKGKEKLQSEEDVVDQFRAVVVDSMDQLLEKTDICLDNVLGKVKPVAVSINPVVVKQNAPKPGMNKGRLDPILQHASHIAKPQLSFVTQADNSDEPWIPGLRHKYHAKVPLGYNYRDLEDGERSLENDETKLQTTHPYYYELTHLNYPAHIFQPPSASSSIQSPGTHTLASRPLNMITTPSALQQMITKLKTQKEIAIDLEWHGYRSYRGFLCLMQLSTRDEDWIVDLIELRKVKGGIDEIESLGEVFADPEIVKVLHGADSDIIWLQQDFNLYIVNMFDTYHASKILDFPRHGLAHLLEIYCDFIPDKRYQQADWRIRPLPEEMLQYARSDTHFLLYIYDQLRNALIDRALSTSSRNSPKSPISPGSGSGSESDADQDQNHSTGTPTRKRKSPKISQLLHQQQKQQYDKREGLIRQVLAKSAETCLKVYANECYDSEGGSGKDGWDTLARKWNKPGFMARDIVPEGSMGTVMKMQRDVYVAVHEWRDKVAREEDESTRYVLPNHFLFMLAERPPAEMSALLMLFNSVPPVVKRRAKELLEVVRGVVKRSLSSAQAQSQDTTGGDAVMKDGGSRMQVQATATNADVKVSGQPEGETKMEVEVKSLKVKRDLWSYRYRSDINASPSISTSNESTSITSDTNIPVSTLSNHPQTHAEIQTQTQTRNQNGRGNLVASSSSLFGPNPKLSLGGGSSGQREDDQGQTLQSLNEKGGGSSLKSANSRLFGNTIGPARNNHGASDQSEGEDVKDIGALFGRKRRGPFGVNPIWAASDIASRSTNGLDDSTDIRLERFKDLVSRIHSTLVIAPSANASGLVTVNSTTTIKKTTIATSNPANTLIDAPNAHTSADDQVLEQIEVPFIPSSQRKTKREVVEDDSIVVVGQPKQKKRKRAKLPISELGGVSTLATAAGELIGGTEEGDNGVNGDTGDANEGSGKSSGAASGDEPAFDFAQVPNILDGNPGLEAEEEDARKSKKKKQNKDRGTGHFYGDFPAPPKARSELKSGNQSHTFRK
ncbi:hypothetical protein AX16_004125 [Volvariella volvacea WC 439]|nr:hypothetical protein AX16_004125 [Volvariella volvacea WC 439]